MGLKVADLFAKLRLDTKEYEDGLSEAKKALGEAGKSISKFGGKLMKSVTLPLAGAGVAGTKMALDLENGIKKVMTLADAEILPASKIQEEVRAISDASGIAQTEVAEAVYSALSAGVDSANVMEFVRSGINLTRAGFTDMETAIDATTTVLNAYGDKAYDVSKIHDIFIQTQDKGKITVDELGKSIGRVVPAASSLGVNIDQLGASYAILTAKGQNAELATTNLNAMLNELGATGSKSDKALKEITGKSFAQLTEEGKSVGEVLGMLDEYAKANNLSLKDMFGSMNAGSAALTLLSEGVEGYNAMLKEMDGATGKTAKNAETMEDGWFKINKAMTQAKNTLIDVGAALAPYIEKAAIKVSKLVEKFNGLDKGTKSSIMKFVGLAAVIPPIIAGVGKLITTILSVEKAFTIIKGLSLAPLVASVAPVIGIVAIVTGVVTGVILAIKNWDKIKPIVTKIWGGVKSAITTILSGITTVIHKTWNGIVTVTTSVFGGLKNTVSTIWMGIKKAILTPINQAVSGVKSAVEKIKGFFSGLDLKLHIKVPHFTFSGSMNPLKWAKEGVPKIGVKWYAKGGVFDKPSVIGVGEAGSEAVVPLAGNRMKPFAREIASLIGAGAGGGEVVTQNITVQVQASDLRQMSDVVQLFNNLAKTKRSR